MIINEDGSIIVEETDKSPQLKPRWIPTSPWPEFVFVTQKGIYDIYKVVDVPGISHFHKQDIGWYITLEKQNRDMTWWGSKFKTIEEIPNGYQ